MKYFFIYDDQGNPIYFDHPNGRLICLTLGQLSNPLGCYFGESVTALFAPPIKCIVEKIDSLNYVVVSDVGESEPFLKIQLRQVHDILVLLFGEELSPKNYNLFSRNKKTIQQMIDTLTNLCDNQQYMLVRAIERLEVEEELRGMWYKRLKKILEQEKSVIHGLLFVGTKLLTSYSVAKHEDLDHTDILLLIIYLKARFHPPKRELVQEREMSVLDIAKRRTEQQQQQNEENDQTINPENSQSNDLEVTWGEPNIIEALYDYFNDSTNANDKESKSTTKGMIIKSSNGENEKFRTPLSGSPNTVFGESDMINSSLNTPGGSIIGTSEYTDCIPIDSEETNSYDGTLSEKEAFLKLKNDVIDYVTGIERDPELKMSSTVKEFILKMIQAVLRTNKNNNSNNSKGRGGEEEEGGVTRYPREIYEIVGCGVTEVDIDSTSSDSSSSITTRENSAQESTMSSNVDVKESILIKKLVQYIFKNKIIPYQPNEDYSSSNNNEDDANLSASAKSSTPPDAADNNNNNSNKEQNNGQQKQEDAQEPVEDEEEDPFEYNFGRINPLDRETSTITTKLFLRNNTRSANSPPTDTGSYSSNASYSQRHLYIAELDHLVTLVLILSPQHAPPSQPLPQPIISSLSLIRETMFFMIRNYVSFLVTKQHTHIPILSYIHLFPGLIHFIFVHRSINRVIAPGISALQGEKWGSASMGLEEKRMRRIVKEKVWEMVWRAQEKLAEGCVSVIGKIGGWQWSWRLWIEDDEMDVGLGDLGVSVQPPEGGGVIGDARWYERLAGRLFPGRSGLKLYELFTLYLGVLSVKMIVIHDRQLVSHLLSRRAAPN
eukprot:TRINITY_DN954_c0_g1_i1.p1 TRINITY_DN954_c0_g1~~TRINITY_DN954_c0_g1_i1.p1  ORF type:complete len:831 (-),score=249.28 TRINITY_DN954_c0_g1_i1:66-2558(-)